MPSLLGRPARQPGARRATRLCMMSLPDVWVPLTTSLVGAKVKVFDHNDPAHLEAVLRAAIAEGQPRTGRPWKKIVS